MVAACKQKPWALFCGISKAIGYRLRIVFIDDQLDLPHHPEVEAFIAFMPDNFVVSAHKARAVDEPLRQNIEEALEIISNDFIQLNPNNAADSSILVYVVADFFFCVRAVHYFVIFHITPPS